MKIVFLDAKSIGKDVDFTPFTTLGEFVTYDCTDAALVPERTADADVIISNKTLINEQTIGRADKLKLVCVCATGTNNLDKDYLQKRGIAWRNVAGYSTDSVAQHTFALLFYLLHNLRYYDDYVKSGEYTRSDTFTNTDRPFTELLGKTYGIIGLGAIGKKVAQIAQSFGMKVIYYSTGGKNHNPDYEEVSYENLLRRSDIISIHAPLNEKTEHLIDASSFKLMKNTAILINVGRGPIIVEKDLADAINCGQISAAGLDVLDNEPMLSDNPLRSVKDSGRLIITPHIAWASTEAKKRLMDTVYNQIKEFLE